MTENDKKKILIVGSSAREYSVAQKLSKTDDVGEIFVAPGNPAMKNFATIVDIRETEVSELLEFAVKNEIYMTVASSEKAIKSDIVGTFQANNQMIFAPSLESAQICLSKSTGKRKKKKNHVPCTRFGIFEKQSLAEDYLNNAKMPMVVKTDEHQ